MGVFEFFTKIGNVVYLSILWFVGSLPVFTIGASTTAYCYMLNKVIWDKEGYITRGFIDAYKTNFKSSTKVWLIMMMVTIVFVANFFIIWNLARNNGGIYIYLIPFYSMLLFLLWATLIYIFPYMAKFENTTVNVIKNSFLMATRHLGYTMVMMILDVIVIIIGFGVFLLLAFITPALIGFINVGLLNFVFRRYVDT